MRIYTKKQGETLDALTPLVTNGNPIPAGASKGNIITSDGTGQVEDSGVSVSSLLDGTQPVGDSNMLGGLSAESFYNLGVPTQIIPTNGADLNDYTTIGKYYCSNSTNVLNYPPNISRVPFILIVENSADNVNRVTQTFYAYNTHSSQCVRNNESGVWRSWKPITNQTNALTPNNFPSNLSNHNAKLIYVSPSGDDSNDGSSSSVPMKTIDGAINKHKGAYTLQLQLADGEYTMSGTYSGYQELILNSINERGATIKTTSQSTFFGNVFFNKVIIEYVGTVATNIISFGQNATGLIEKCTIRGVDTSIENIGINVSRNSNITVNECIFGGTTKHCVYVNKGATARVYACTKEDNATITYGCYAVNGGFIIENCSQVLGANYRSGGGTIISTNGTTDMGNAPRLTSLSTTAPTTATNGLIYAVYE